ncbi:MAG: hypothetical protein A4E53_01351 [Pelotomaculum sp. PtaB.Bin104]|nr:MAG: hypothetical protein A4E53_01351 [Pelotomaculum sp. PtaB.Bin104]
MSRKLRKFYEIILSNSVGRRWPSENSGLSKILPRKSRKPYLSTSSFNPRTRTGLDQLVKLTGSLLLKPVYKHKHYVNTVNYITRSPRITKSFSLPSRTATLGKKPHCSKLNFWNNCRLGSLCPKMNPKIVVIPNLGDS